MQTHCVGRDNQQLNLSTLTLLYRHILLSPVTEGDSNSQHFSFDIVLYVPIPDPSDHSSRAIATLQPQLECQSEPSVLSHRAPKCSYLVQQHPSCAYKPILSELKSQVPAHKPRRAKNRGCSARFPITNQLLISVVLDSEGVLDVPIHKNTHRTYKSPMI